MKKIIPALLFAVNSVLCSATETKTIYEEIPNVGKYEYFLKNSIGKNRDVFEIYESKNGGKVLVACIPNAYGFYMQTEWDLIVRSEAEASRIATKICSQKGHGFVLIGYGLGGVRKF
jgi:hypothetical protein